MTHAATCVNIHNVFFALSFRLNVYDVCGFDLRKLAIGMKVMKRFLFFLHLEFVSSFVKKMYVILFVEVRVFCNAFPNNNK